MALPLVTMESDVDRNLLVVVGTSVRCWEDEDHSGDCEVGCEETMESLMLRLCPKREAREGVGGSASLDIICTEDDIYSDIRHQAVLAYGC